MSDSADRSSPESSPEIEVPAEIRRSSVATPHTTGCLLAAIFVGAPALVYFGFFGILLVDELVLNTRFFSSDRVPQPVIDGLTVIYAPLIYLTRLALGIK